MPLHSYFVLFAFTFLLFAFVLQLIRLRNSTSEFLGHPTIEKLPFYSAKIAIFTTWALFILKATNPRLGYIDVPPILSWISVVLLYIGVILFSLSLFNLGKALKVGLPDQDTKLQTRGVYRLSRNPLYLGVHFIAIASCFYFPDLINVSFTIYGIFMHHKIIKEEERFLAERFGKDWLVYCTKVSRYL
jgi:protein-S-isoprenylcysteine O-methyltransferase Ste14